MAQIKFKDQYPITWQHVLLQVAKGVTMNSLGQTYGISERTIGRWIKEQFGSVDNLKKLYKGRLSTQKGASSKVQKEKSKEQSAKPRTRTKTPQASEHDVQYLMEENRRLTGDLNAAKKILNSLKDKI